MNYKYSKLSFYRNLWDESTSIPLAILVEGSVGDDLSLLIIGRDIHVQQLQDLDYVSKKMIEQTKKLLDNQLANLPEKVTSILELLAQGNKYSFNVSTPTAVPADVLKVVGNSKSGESELGKIGVIAMTLFARHVFANEIKNDHMLNSIRANGPFTDSVQMASPNSRFFIRPTVRHSSQTPVMQS